MLLECRVHLIVVHKMYTAVKVCLLPSIYLAVDSLLSFSIFRSCAAAVPALT